MLRLRQTDSRLCHELGRQGDSERQSAHQNSLLKFYVSCMPATTIAYNLSCSTASSCGSTLLNVVTPELRSCHNTRSHTCQSWRYSAARKQKPNHFPFGRSSTMRNGKL